MVFIFLNSTRACKVGRPSQVLLFFKVVQSLQALIANNCHGIRPKNEAKWYSLGTSHPPFTSYHVQDTLDGLLRITKLLGVGLFLARLKGI